MWTALSQFHFWQHCILPRTLVSVTTFIIPLAFLPVQLSMETDSYGPNNFDDVVELTLR